MFENVDVLFPSAKAFLAPLGIGMVEVESAFDLANVQFVRHVATGVWAAEHYMALPTRTGDGVVMPAGW